MLGHRAAWLEGLGYDVPEQMFTEGYEAEDIYKRGAHDYPKSCTRLLSQVLAGCSRKSSQVLAGCVFKPTLLCVAGTWVSLFFRCLDRGGSGFSSGASQHASSASA